jgi:hypothetical protein
MKIQILAAASALLALGGAEAFCPPKAGAVKMTKTSLQARNKNNDWVGSATVAAMGWALASQIAVAGMLPTPADQEQQAAMVSSSSFVAVEKLDFSLPSYESSVSGSVGFGEGAEARLGLTDSMTDPGSNEKAKQEEAMKKAEEARLARKQEQKRLQREREEEMRRRDEEKKADADRRIKELFG